MIDQKKLTKHIEAVADALKQIGDDSKEVDPNAEHDQVVGAVLATAIGCACQTYGVAKVRSVLGNFVSGSVSEQFWALQQKLHDSEKKEPQSAETIAGAPAPVLPSG